MINKSNKNENFKKNIYTSRPQSTKIFGGEFNQFRDINAEGIKKNANQSGTNIQKTSKKDFNESKNKKNKKIENIQNTYGINDSKRIKKNIFKPNKFRKVKKQNDLQKFNKSQRTRKNYKKWEIKEENNSRENIHNKPYGKNQNNFYNKKKNLSNREKKRLYYKKLFLEKNKKIIIKEPEISPPVVIPTEEVFTKMYEISDYSIINECKLEKKIIYLNKQEMVLYKQEKKEHKNKNVKKRKIRFPIKTSVFDFFKKKQKKKRYKKKFIKSGISVSLVPLFLILKLKSYMNMLAFNISSTYNFKAKKLKIFFFQLHDMNASAAYLARYIALKLLQKYPLMFIMKNILSFFISKRFKKNIIGFKVCCSGRVSRKQRATYYWKSFGLLGTSSCTTKLDYFFCTIPLKFGAAGVKVWMLNGKTLNFNI